MLHSTLNGLKSYNILKYIDVLVQSQDLKSLTPCHDQEKSLTPCHDQEKSLTPCHDQKKSLTPCHDQKKSLTPCHGKYYPQNSLTPCHELYRVILATSCYSSITIAIVSAAITTHINSE